MIVIYSYQTREVRDLAWACFSPSLMQTGELCHETMSVSPCALLLTPQRAAWLERLDRDPASLLATLVEAPVTRLGLYFERLWHFFLQSDPEIELLAHNLPVRDQGRTLGEFDCIYYCHRRQCHVHLELAVKFYLGITSLKNTQQYSQCQDWWGPNSADRLDLKITHMMQRQIRLADHPAARHQLEALGIQDLVREVEIKGYLFRGAGDSLPPPQGFNAAHSIESWTTAGQLTPFLEAHKHPYYFPLPRLHWLSPARLDQPQQALDRPALEMLQAGHFATSARPQLVAGLNENGSETERFFVTADNWPQSSRLSQQSGAQQNLTK